MATFRHEGPVSDAPDILPVIVVKFHIIFNRLSICLNANNDTRSSFESIGRPCINWFATFNI